MATFTISQQLDCVKREINMRKKVYPRFIQFGKLSQERADYELNCMQEVFNTLSKIKVEEEDKDSLFK